MKSNTILGISIKYFTIGKHKKSIKTWKVTPLLGIDIKYYNDFSLNIYSTECTDITHWRRLL